ncbi:hypothetical protein COCMIDRAFT_94199 [Bipolaris oryzae ATCC 44560]|uniref:Uncharacterized protein n=1 Tax=Bipolaris oryzae ATCC 44560 TaxID=930090 RepID=W6ZQA3_COCMI|nr:uncharacterized protein COCMIDRAFT_94199 [Bipolaris oryzae ATCC 44560]EUC45916.1 hypothetical protein COCMIDRAFT_94199 [Bipolaris oryzae ATCC 44560]
MLTGVSGQCATGEIVKNPSAEFFSLISSTRTRSHPSDVYLYTSFILAPFKLSLHRAYCSSRRSQESPTGGTSTCQPSVSRSLCIESLLDRWLHTARLHDSHKLVSLETAPSRAAPGLSNTVAYR